MQTKHDFHRDGFQPPGMDVYRGRQKTTLGQGTPKLIKDDGTNYILIVNQQSQKTSKTQIPNAEMLLKSTNAPQFVLSENKSKMSGTNARVTHDKVGHEQWKPQSKTISRCKGHFGSDIRERVKLNFSDLGFDNYDSTASSINVFNDDSEKKECSAAVKSLDEGYSESAMIIEGFVQQQHTDLNLDETEAMKSPNNVSRSTYTPSTCNIDLSGSSGYQSAGGSSWLTSPTPSDLTSPSPNNAAKQVILISPGPSRTIASSVSSQEPSNYSITSPVSSLACNLKGTAFFQSPTGISPVLSQIQHDLGKPLSSSTPVENKSISVSAINTSTGASPIPSTTNSIKNFTQVQTSTAYHPLDSRASAAKCLKSMNIVLPNLSQIPKTNTKMTITEKGIKQEPPEPPDPQAGEVVIHINIKEQQTVVKMEKDQSRPSTPHLFKSESQSPDLSNTSDCLNNSLTNMHWLKGIQGINEAVQGSPRIAPSVVETPKSVASNPLQWRCLSTSDVEKIARECGRHKRPPFSYMTLIQMALNSREDKRMTLREICHWIEDTFLYYRYTAKPGWKNSIRHNLSLYSIFEREKSKKHGSHWTIRDDCPEKSKSVPARDGLRKGAGQLGIGTMLPLTLPTFLQQSHGPKLALPPNPALTDRSKKGPQPILPRPMAVSQTPLQTYALIPIQNMGQGVQQGIQIPDQGQPMIIQLAKSGQSLASHSNPESPLLSPLVPNAEEKPSCTRLKKKRYSIIAPKETSLPSSSPKQSISIVRQAWLDSQNTSTSDDGDTNRLRDSKCSPTSQAQTGAKKPKLRAGLPKPKIYMRTTPPSRKGKARRKQKLVAKERELMADSSEEELDNLEQEDPLTNVLSTSSSTTVSTSTPLKACGFPSPQMPSPIIGLTPLRSSGLLDSSFLDCLKDSDTESKGFLISPDIRCAKKLSLGQNRTPPNSTVLDFNFSFSQTPLRCDPGTDFGGGDHNQSLSKFLAEFPIDTNMMEDGLPVDISSLNWSVGEQDQSPLSS
ncbi:uncharacterized protein LOC117335436 [Pecten maximus]|uniref:uncharacterized protein LOC117335436 n=1 Tax=Pecten maximus TaxID=6579 RepID=UPI0014590CBE|nr:uncharacterized protein LOC117335436 [Pecten maximus]